MGTTPQMPEGNSKRARQSGGDSHSRQSEKQTPRERHFELPENLESVAESIPALFDFKHGVDKERRDAFTKKIDSLSPHRAYDIARTISAAYDAFSVYQMLNATPVMELSEATVPVSPGSWMKDLIGAGAQSTDQLFDSFSAIRKGFRDWTHLREGNRVINFKDGLSLFGENLGKFISKRIEGLRFWKNDPPPDLTPPDPDTGLFTVTVNCHTRGYRILYSPAYFVEWVYFGAPSSPVRSDILPGKYIFGTDSEPGCVLCDGAIFKVPSDFNPYLARF